MTYIASQRRVLRKNQILRAGVVYERRSHTLALNIYVKYVFLSEPTYIEEELTKITGQLQDLTLSRNVLIAEIVNSLW